VPSLINPWWQIFFPFPPGLSPPLGNRVGCLKVSQTVTGRFTDQQLVSLKIVSADLKGSQFSRFRCEPESLPVVVEHTNAAAAVEKQAVTIVSFFPASAG
jgi:hypothetical protein